jgi:L-fuculose-phosphate aldolase
MCDHNTLVRTPLIARVHQGEDGLSCHVDESGRPLYAARYQAVSAFSEGFAVAHRISGEATLIDQQGRQLVTGSHRFRWILPMSEGRAQACTNNGAPGWIDTSGVFHPVGSSPEWQARQDLTRVAHLIYERGYNVSIDGNLSFRLSEDEILMTPSGSHNGFIQPEELVVVDREGSLVRGQGRPTSEYRLHTALYRRRPDIRAVIHAHSPYAVAASLAGIDLLKTWISAAPVPTTRYGRISSPESPRVMEPYMDDYSWAILPRHGTVAWSDSIWSAFLRIEGLEHSARIVVTAQAAGPIEPLPQDRRLELLTFWGLEHLEVQ